MTRSSQQPPVSSSPQVRAESAAEEPVASASTAAPDAPGPTPSTAAEPRSGPAEAEAAGNARKETPETPGTPETEGEAGKASGEAGEGTTTAPEAAPGGAPSEPEADPGAAAVAQSRLPALVRTMTATAIGRPQQKAGPVGRPGKAVLAGAAVAGALLVSVPLLVIAGNDDKGPERPSVAAAGTVLDGSGQEAPGDFAVTPDGTGSPTAEDRKKDTDDPASGKPGQKAPVPDKAEDTPKKAAEPEAQPKEQPKEQSGTKEAGSAQKQPAKAPPAVTFSAAVSFRSHLSGRCIDVPNHDFSDGKALHVWDCNNAPAQMWRFASDGTIRIKDKCLDVANANFSNGTPIQIAWCNGNAAQKFALNGAHDLVNTAVGMCVDIAGANRDRGAALQLLTCTGNDAQKWST
ncbi:RICIN domain-containing protein [Streptomyces sp. NBC_01520]|uniref:ricin-type beta-trefoil lectin domain protein n=1 Tax=Streptomyces sp. NBC_01520 TaxID=2903892 RepID=UPI00386B1E77